MSPEKQRIAIAQACGWKLVMDNPLYEPYWEDPKGNKIGISCGMRFPDYLNNLNACHEFEKKLIGLGPPALDTYELFLLAICTRAGHRIFRATAAQRCEAFLKTINK